MFLRSLKGKFARILGVIFLLAALAILIESCAISTSCGQTRKGAKKRYKMWGH